MRKAISKLCGINERTYYVWKKKSHIELIALIEEYFTEEMIYEFLETGRISSKEEDLKQDIKSYIDEQIEKRLKEKNL